MALDKYGINRGKVRPAWMPSGKLHGSGIPSSLLEGRFTSTRPEVLRFARKLGDRRSRMEELQKERLQLGYKRGLTTEQKLCGARFVG